VRLEVRGSKFEDLELQTSNPRVSLVPPVSRISLRYPAGVFSCCATRTDHRNSSVPIYFSAVC